MRAILVAMIIAAGVAMLGSGGASAVPPNGAAILQASDQTGQVIAVAGGCGRGWHRGPRGGCRRN